MIINKILLNKYLNMQRKVISLHKNLQGPKTPNTDAVHTHVKHEPILKKKSNSQTSLKQKNLKQRNASNTVKSVKGQQSPHQKKIKSKSKSKSMKKSGSKADSSQLHKQKRHKNVYTGDDNGVKPNFLQNLTQKSFSNVQALKLNLLSFIFKQRLVRDQQYNDLYEHLVERFPDKEDIIKTMLFQIVSTLDS